MAEPEKRRYLRVRDGARDGTDWGYRVRMIRRLGQQERKFTLYYLRTEGSATFCKLFASRNSCPGAICIQNYFQDFELQDETSLLARALRTTDRRPRLLFGDTRWVAQPGTWQSYGAWFNMKAVAVAAEPAPGDKVFDLARRVSLHFQSDQDDARDFAGVDAVVFTRSALGAQRLPEGVEFIPFSRIGSNRPMQECLQQLEAICRDKGISRVATLPFGLEDEGIVLREWAMKEGLPKEIHFHCSTPGDMHSLDLDAAAALPPASAGAVAEPQRNEEHHADLARYYDFLYSLLPGFDRFTTATVEAISRHVQPCKTLDLGAGTGRMALPLNENGFTVTAIDCSEPMLEQLRTKLHEAGRVGQIEVVHASIAGMNVQEHRGDFGLAICVHTVLNYVLEEAGLQAIAENILRHLRPGGVLIIDLALTIRGLQYPIPGGQRQVRVRERNGHADQYVVSEHAQGRMGDEEFEYQADDWIGKYWPPERVIHVFTEAGFAAHLDDRFREDLELQYRPSGCKAFILRKPD